MTSSRTDYLEHLPIFPLAEAVFFPNTLLPLHVFQPRYRKLTEDVLAKETPMAVVQLKAGEPAVMGLPRVYPVAGMGRILGHRKLSDGRYYLLLQGIARVRIKEELETTEPYRIVRAEVLNDEYPNDPKGIETDRVTLKSLALSMARAQPQLAALLAEVLTSIEDPSMLSDALASMLIRDPVARQGLLETSRVELRFQKVTEAVAELAGAGEEGPGDPQLVS